VRASIANFAEVAWSWHARFARATAAIATPEVEALRARVDGYLRGVPRPPTDASGDPVILRTIGMTLRFGPSRDVTIEELSVDILCPRDEQADSFFRSLASTV
jgi:hypothetical protein